MGVASIQVIHYNIKHNFLSSVIKIQQKYWQNTKQRADILTYNRRKHFAYRGILEKGDDDDS